MGFCRDCEHFRAAIAASDVLKQAFGRTRSEDVENAIAKIVEDEEKVREGEEGWKKTKGTSHEAVWRAPPAMSAYCGLQEREGIFGICEVKNAGGRCTSFSPAPMPSLRCADCIHRVPADGWDEDVRIQREYSEMAALGTVARYSTGQPESLLESARKSAASNQALEIKDAYRAKGRLFSKPRYLDHCARLSRDGAFVVCALENPHGTCPDWSSTQPQPQPTVVAAPVLPPAAPGPAAAPSSDELAEFVEWLLDVRFSVTLRMLFRQLVNDQLGSGDPRAVAVLEQWQTTWQRLHEAAPDVREGWRAAHQEQFAESFRRRSDDLARAITALFDERDAPIAAGDPPLTENAARASFELYRFMSAAVRGSDMLDAGAVAARAWRDELVRLYPTLPPAARAFFAGAPQTLAALRARWETLPEAQRTAASREWAGQLAGLAPLAERAFGPLPPPPSRPAAPPEPVSEAEAELARQKEMYQRQVHSQLESQAAQMEHDTIMKIIGNIHY